MDKESVADYYYMKCPLVKTISCNEQSVEVQNADGDEYQLDYHSLWRYYTPVRNIQLAETCAMMVSSDYKERFKAEYIQLANRYKGLKNLVELWDAGRLDFTPTCERTLYDQQLMAMSLYIDVLNIRAEKEGVDLCGYKIDGIK